MAESNPISSGAAGLFIYDAAVLPESLITENEAPKYVSFVYNGKVVKFRTQNIQLGKHFQQSLIQLSAFHQGSLPKETPLTPQELAIAFDAYLSSLTKSTFPSNSVFDGSSQSDHKIHRKLDLQSAISAKFWQQAQLVKSYEHWTFSEDEQFDLYKTELEKILPGEAVILTVSVKNQYMTELEDGETISISSQEELKQIKLLVCRGSIDETNKYTVTFCNKADSDSMLLQLYESELSELFSSIVGGRPVFGANSKVVLKHRGGGPDQCYNGREPFVRSKTFYEFDLTELNDFKWCNPTKSYVELEEGKRSELSRVANRLQYGDRVIIKKDGFRTAYYVGVPKADGSIVLWAGRYYISSWNTAESRALSHLINLNRKTSAPYQLPENAGESEGSSTVSISAAELKPERISISETPEQISTERSITHQEVLSTADTATNDSKRVSPETKQNQQGETSLPDKSESTNRAVNTASKSRDDPSTAEFAVPPHSSITKALLTQAELGPNTCSTKAISLYRVPKWLDFQGKSTVTVGYRFKGNIIKFTIIKEENCLNIIGEYLNVSQPKIELRNLEDAFSSFISYQPENGKLRDGDFYKPKPLLVNALPNANQAFDSSHRESVAQRVAKKIIDIEVQQANEYSCPETTFSEKDCPYWIDWYEAEIVYLGYWFRGRKIQFTLIKEHKKILCSGDYEIADSKSERLHEVEFKEALMAMINCVPQNKKVRTLEDVNSQPSCSYPVLGAEEDKHYSLSYPTENPHSSSPSPTSIEGSESTVCHLKTYKMKKVHLLDLVYPELKHWSNTVIVVFEKGALTRESSSGTRIRGKTRTLPAMAKWVKRGCDVIVISSKASYSASDALSKATENVHYTKLSGSFNKTEYPYEVKLAIEEKLKSFGSVNVYIIAPQDMKSEVHSSVIDTQLIEFIEKEQYDVDKKISVQLFQIME